MSVAHDSVPIATVESDRWRVHPTFTGLRVSRVGEVQSSYRMKGCGSGTGKGARIRVVTGVWRSLKSQSLPCGYRYIHLSYRTPEGKTRKRILYVHRLVAECFIGPRPPGTEICHGNGDRSDNRVENIRYGTKAENSADSERHGTRAKGSRHGIAKLREEDVKDIIRRLIAREPPSRVAAAHGVSQGAVELIRSGKTWIHVPRPGPIPLLWRRRSGSRPR